VHRHAAPHPATVHVLRSSLAQVAFVATDSLPSRTSSEASSQKAGSSRCPAASSANRSPSWGRTPPRRSAEPWSRWAAMHPLRVVTATIDVLSVCSDLAQEDAARPPAQCWTGSPSSLRLLLCCAGDVLRPGLVGGGYRSGRWPGESSNACIPGASAASAAHGRLHRAVAPMLVRCHAAIRGSTVHLRMAGAGRVRFGGRTVGFDGHDSPRPIRGDRRRDGDRRECWLL
jgi:hypothetical protein